MRYWGIVAGLAVGLAVTVAYAQDEDPRVKAPVGRKMFLESKGRALYVVRGKLRAPVPTGKSMAFLEGATVKDGSVEVEYMESNCETSTSQVYTVDHLEARLYNARGVLLQRKKKYDKAAVQYAVANKLDPDFRKAATNYAGALSLGGKPDKAAAALAHWIKKNPVLVYDKVMVDSDFMAIRDATEITALAAKPPGTAALAANGKVDGKSMAAYSEDKQLLAFLWDENTNSEGCDTTRHIVFFRVGTSGDSFTIDVGGEDQYGEDPGDCTKFAPSKDGVARANRILKDLGFKRVWAAEGTELEGDSRSTYLLSNKSKLVLAYDSELVQLTRGKKVVYKEEGEFYGGLSKAYLVPAAGVVVYTVAEAAGDCAGYDPQHIHVLAVPKK